MNKDRQDAAQKRRAVVRIADPRREAKRARGSTKAAASGSSRQMPAAKPVAPGPSKASAGTKIAASGGTKPPSGGSAKGRELPSPGRRVADFGSDEGKLVFVPPSAAITSPTAVVRAKGVVQNPWAAFCASGEILPAAATKDVAGSMSQRLREASQ
eukprot:XP_008650638.1 uncharacterized protein LOC103631524 [Zea mays]